MAKMNTMYSDLIRCLTKYRSDGESNSTRFRQLGEIIRHLKEIVKTIFDINCETGLYTLKFHSLHHLVEILRDLETRKPWMHRHL